MELQNKVELAIGAGRGIGRAIALVSGTSGAGLAVNPISTRQLNVFNMLALWLA